MFSKTIQWLFMFSVLIGCDKRKDGIQKLNIKPQMHILSLNQKLNSCTDSLKMSKEKGKKIALQFEDENISFLKVKNSSETANLMLDGRHIRDILPIDSKKISLEVKNTKEELLNIDFIAKDDLRGESKATFSLLCFENLAPIAQLSFKEVAKGSYLFDASKSFDQDMNQGGGIEWYVFHIAEKEHRLKTPLLLHDFEESGKFEVSLVVIDNEGKSSKPINQTILINEAR